jgi:hypothetical protein
MSFGLPDPDEALREAEQRDLEAELKAEQSKELAEVEKSPEPDANDDEDDGDKP